MAVIHDTTTEQDTHEPLKIRDALAALVGYIRDHSPLELDGPWNIGASHARGLRTRFGEVPGGWDAFFGVVADSPWIAIEHARIHARVTPHSLEQTSARELDELLVAQFRRRLSPPGVYAGLGLLMGLHPYWSIQAANARHGELDIQGSGSFGASEGATIRLVLEGIDQATQGIFDALAELTPGHDHDVATFTGDVASACGMGSMHIAAGVLAQPSRSPIPVLMGTRVWESRPHALDFVTKDLLPGYLVPARLVCPGGGADSVTVTQRARSSHVFVKPGH